MISLFETISRLYSTSTSSDLISEASNGGDSSNNSNSNSIINESRSFIRRAWDKVETIFIQRQEETTVLPTYLEHLQESDDVQDEEFIHPNPYHEHNRDLIYRRNLRKRRLSQHSQELISAIPEEEDPSPSVDWNSISDLQQYDGWRNDLLDIEQSQEGNVKNMVAGWAMGEASPWFD